MSVSGAGEGMWDRLDESVVCPALPANVPDVSDFINVSSNTSGDGIPVSGFTWEPRSVFFDDFRYNIIIVAVVM